MLPGPAQRIIDANANRVREALRVMEDAARFVLDDADLCARLKELRHDLATALASTTGVPPVALIAWRDTQGDVGTVVSTPAEMSRASMRDVVIAAGKRLTEALRSMEEYAKLPTGGTPVPPNATSSAAATIEQLRYRAYECERRLVMAMGCGRADFKGWRLCVVVTESLCRHHPWLEVARRAIAGGADCIQLREKNLDGAELLGRARRLVELAGRGEGADISSHGSESRATRRGAGRAAAIINDRPDIALLSGADGVHLGQTDLRVEEARKIVGFDLLIGVSTENLDQARAARSAGADYCGVGPMFATTTKDKPRLAGPGYLAEYLAAEPALPPCLAIGGVTPERAGELAVAAGAHRLGDGWGAAASSAVCAASDPGAACAAILSALDAGGA